MNSHHAAVARLDGPGGQRARIAALLPRASPWLPWLLAGLTGALTTAGLGFLALSWAAPVPDTFAFRGHAALMALAFGSVGQFLARRRPENAIGWLFLAAGLAGAIQEFGQEYAAYAYFVRADALLPVRLIAWLASWIFATALGSLVFAVLLFPNGRLPSARWRPFGWALLTLWSASLLGSMIKPGPLRFAPYFDNPFGADRRIWELISSTAGVGLAASLIVIAMSIIARLQLAKGIEREQLKWFAYTAAVFCAAGLIYTTVYPMLGTTQPALAKPIDILAVVIPALMPFAVAFAILRHGLYDIDHVINRTLVYGALSAAVLMTYVLIVGLMGALLDRNVGLAATVTAVLAALFLPPLHRRLQRVLDRAPAASLVAASSDDSAETSAPALAASLSRWLPWTAFGLTVVLSALDVILLVANGPVPGTGISRVPGVLYTLTYGGIGNYLARKRPQNAIGWLFLLFGLIAAVGAVGGEYASYALFAHPGSLPGGLLAAWIVSWLFLTIVGLAIFIVFLFPTGRLPSTRWRPMVWATAAVVALAIALQMIKPGPLRMAPYVDNPLGVAGNADIFGVVNSLDFAAAVLCQLAAAASVILRLRRATGVERQQLKWFAYTAGLLMIVGLFQAVPATFDVVMPEWWSVFNIVLPIAIVALPFSVAIAILRYRLYDIDRVIHHTLVYGTLTAGIVVLYVVLVGALGMLSQTSGNLLLSLLATGLIAFLVQPLRERLQRAVNRLMYGERDEPYPLVARLGQDLAAAVAPDAILVTLVDTLAQALKLPYVAVEIGNPDDAHIAAAHGRASPHAERIPLLYRDETVGCLLVAPRADDEPLDQADLDLLRSVARQAGMAVRAVQLTADLQRSRERLVVAREEERRRIRRDLHDGLGSVLAALAMEADGAREWVSSDPAKAEAALADITSRAQGALQDIRRLVYDLRPPALDELGLVGALRQAAANSPNGLQIEIDARMPLPPLSAALEVAAYRIAQETLNNVARHAHARRCVVKIAARDGLRLEISDDGTGMPAGARSGVGLLSMRERAAELGGTCEVQSAPGGGTRVIACLPLPPAEPSVPSRNY